MTTGDTFDQPNARVTQYRLGKVLSLFERVEEKDDIDDVEFYRAVKDAFEKFPDVQLYEPLPQSYSPDDVTSHPASFRTFRRSGGKHKLAQLPLKQWRDDLERQDDADGNQTELDDATEAVPHVC